MNTQRVVFVAVFPALADAVTTWLLLLHGGIETNPVVAGAMGLLGVVPALALRIVIGAGVVFATLQLATLAQREGQRAPWLLGSAAAVALTVIVMSVAVHNLALLVLGT